MTEAYTFLHWVGPPKCDGDSAQALAYPVRWVVANKGELDFALAESGCVNDGAVGMGGVGQAFTITGGTGMYFRRTLEAAMSTLVSDWAPTASFMEVRNLDWHAERAGLRLRRYGARAHRCGQQDGQGAERVERRPRDLPRQSARRQGRRATGLVQAPVGQSIPDWPHRS